MLLYDRARVRNAASVPAASGSVVASRATNTSWSTSTPDQAGEFGEQHGVREDRRRQKAGGFLAGGRVTVVPEARGQGVREPGVDIGLDVPAGSPGELVTDGFVPGTGLGLLQVPSSRSVWSSSARAATLAASRSSASRAAAAAASAASSAWTTASASGVRGVVPCALPDCSSSHCQERASGSASVCRQAAG
ncbi:hypothetical protein [Streptomyces sp. ME01-18h]|uniref:hypothetical protein n=1 Tax=Streptomyces sp. ME01-18h TaxID=462920 RepID=UPI0029ABE8CE|nr:hypothetical protein [Streptomyces sp. ME01-18h]MDX3403425.1 hypothetical protein [Streptomyces sp. ME01-18h]